jgi:hypothetical protein
MILKVHVDGALSYELGDEIWQGSLDEAITTEAEAIADCAESDVPGSKRETQHDALRDRVIAEMTSALLRVGDRYRAPDGVLYSLVDDTVLDSPADAGRLSTVRSRVSEPIVEEVLRFEDLPVGSPGTRRAIARWSDGTVSTAMTWFADEILVCAGDLVDKTADEIRSLHFRRDRDWLQS